MVCKVREKRVGAQEWTVDTFVMDVLLLENFDPH